MLTVKNANDAQLITDALRRDIEERIAIAVRERIESAKAELEAAIPTIIAEISIKLFNRINIEQNAQQLLIRIEKRL